MELRPGWSDVLARRQLLAIVRRSWAWRPSVRKRRRAAARLEIAADYESHCFVSGELAELMALRLPACGRCKACREERVCMREGRGIMILDEAHEWLNARTWDTDAEGGSLTKVEATAIRLAIVRFFALHRKLGWHIYLVTQDEKRLDNQVRGNFEYHTRLKNLRKVKVPYTLGLIPLWFKDLFVAITVWHGSGGVRVGTEMYGINKLADQYDTMASPSLRLGEERDHEVIRLPLDERQVAARARGERIWGIAPGDGEHGVDGSAEPEAKP